MAKLCMTQRETKRLKMVEKFKAKRLALNEVINDASASREQKIEARQKLQALPRNSSPVRLRTTMCFNRSPKRCL